MSSPLHFRVGSKFGVSFQVSPPSAAEVIRKGKVVEGTVATWSRVGVRSILKDHWQDQSGRWRDSIYFYPSDHDGANRAITMGEMRTQPQAVPG